MNLTFGFMKQLMKPIDESNLAKINQNSIIDRPGAQANKSSSQAAPGQAWIRSDLIGANGSILNWHVRSTGSRAGNIFFRSFCLLGVEMDGCW